VGRGPPWTHTVQKTWAENHHMTMPITVKMTKGIMPEFPWSELELESVPAVPAPVPLPAPAVVVPVVGVELELPPVAMK